MVNKSVSDEVTCRTCLTQKRSLRSIFQRYKVFSYAEIIGLVANVKIIPDDGYSNKICKICRSKAVEALEFKNSVQQADQFLRGLKSQCRKLQFNDISEIKIEIDNIKSENIIKNEANRSILKFEWSKEDDITTYNNVSIKKVTRPVSKELTIDQFLDDIKLEVPEYNGNNEDEDHFYDNGDDSISDDEYLSAAIKNKPSARGTPSAKNTVKNKFKKYKEHEDDDDAPFKKLLANKPTAAKPIGRPKKYVYHTDKLSPEERSRIKISNVKIVPILMENCRVAPFPMKEESMKKRKKTLASIRLKREADSKRICPYCAKIVRTKHALSSHLLIHEGVRNFKCPECPKQYHTSLGLKNHMITHSGEKTIQCDKCPMRFYTKGNLISHLRYHIDVREFVCNICSKAFKRNSTLSRHVLRHSSANKTVMCDLCNMSFFEKSQLKSHMRIHTGERPHKCELCSQPYSYKHDFNRHCFNKHGVFMKWRDIRVMNEQVLEQERIAVRSLIESTPELELPTPAKQFPRIMDPAQLNRLFNTTLPLFK